MSVHGAIIFMQEKNAEDAANSNDITKINPFGLFAYQREHTQTETQFHDTLIHPPLSSPHSLFLSVSPSCNDAIPNLHSMTYADA